MRKCVFTCVNKTLLLVHPRNCQLKPVDYLSCDLWFLCISFGHQPITGLHSMIYNIIFTFYYLIFALHFLVFALCLIKLHCSQPILRFKNFFFMSIIMMKNRLHSNSLSSKKSKAFFLFNSHLVSMVQTDPDIIQPIF